MRPSSDVRIVDGITQHHKLLNSSNIHNFNFQISDAQVEWIEQAVHSSSKPLAARLLSLSLALHVPEVPGGPRAALLGRRWLRLVRLMWMEGKTQATSSIAAIM